MTHYGRRRAFCSYVIGTGDNAKPGDVLTMARKKVTCPACLMELSGADLLRAFQRDLDEVL